MKKANDLNKSGWFRVLRLAVLLITFFFFFSVQIVPSESMNPTIKSKDMILYWKTKKINKGDVVLFNAPHKEKTKYVKRVIAVEGDKVQFTNGKVFVNGQVLLEDYVEGNETWGMGSEEIQVPSNSIYVLGDNRSNSEDSRHFGVVDKELVIGNGKIRLLPFIKRLK